MINFTKPKRELKIEDEQDASTYLSIGDLMSGLLMFFALLFITTLFQLQEAREELVKQRRVFVGELIGQLKGNNINVTVNEETGDVSVRESILFDENSAELKPEGKAELQRFIPIYSGVIFFNQEVEKQVIRVIIEGHTSSKGSYEDNMELSLRRALSVTRYIFSEAMKFESQEKLNKKIMAAGRGEIEAKPVDEASDRKVVFRLQFRGEELSEGNLKK